MFKDRFAPQKFKNSIISASPPCWLMENQLKFHSPQNISGASQQNSISKSFKRGFPNQREGEERGGGGVM